jgi:long-chain acyl-CoA synthetase
MPTAEPATSIYAASLWTPSYLAGVPHDIAVEPRSLRHLLDAAVDDCGDRPFLTYRDRTLTYAETASIVDGLAAGFQARGVAKGDRVALCMPNHPAYAITVFALWTIGAVGVGLNPLYAVPTLAAQLADSAPKFLVTVDDEALHSKLAQAWGAAPSGEILTVRTDAEDLISAGPKPAIGNALADLLHGASAPVRPDLDPAADLAMLQYTGGTTGVPKGAMLSHANIYINTHQIGAWWPSLARGLERGAATAPFSHITGLTGVLLVGVANAAEIVVIERFSPQAFFEASRGRPFSFMAAIPTMLVALMNSPFVNDINWSSVKFILSGGAPTPVEVQAGFRKATGITVQPGYGLTETSPGVAVSHPIRADDDASTGYPLPGTIISIRSTTDPTIEVPLGTPGEICVAGPQVMKGYWQRPEETANSMVGGFYRTGDVGYLDETGKLFINDRLKDIIIASGYNVYPTNVENALYRHPAIQEAVVLGMPDSYRGETVAAIVSLKAGADTLTLADLTAFLNDSLSPIEMPKHLEVLPELPKMPTGKLSRAMLRDLVLRHRTDTQRGMDTA